MKEEKEEAVLFAEWILENAYQSYEDDVMMWDLDDVLMDSRSLYLEFVNQQFNK